MEVTSRKRFATLCVITVIALVLIWKCYITYFNNNIHVQVIPKRSSNWDEQSKVAIATQLDDVYAELELLVQSSKVEIPRREMNEVFANLDSALIDIPAPAKSKRQSFKPGAAVIANKDVCPEKYAYDQLSGDYPLFHKGFNQVNCSDAPKFHTLLTLVYNFVHYSSDNLLLIPKLLANINTLYPNVKVIAALPAVSTLAQGKDTKFLKFEPSAADTDIWASLISGVTTKYVYVGRNAIHFEWFDRLERLVRQINSLEASVVAAAFRTLHSGHWSNGCDQSILRNYTLVYRHGYDRSMQECMKCHHVHGPFVAKTELFSQSTLKEHTTETSGFALWFLELKANKRLVVSCPDSMSFVTDESREATSKKDWGALAQLLQVEEIHPTNGPVMEFSCEEANTNCEMSHGTGLEVSLCCRRLILEASRAILTRCQEEDLLCELQDQTLLGAIKFTSVLPWQLDSTVDATIVLHTDNFTTFNERLVPLFKTNGYEVDADLEKKLFVFHSLDWHIQVTTASITSAESIANGMSPTTVSYDGILASIPNNPGLSIKSRYGDDVYEHIHSQLQIDQKSADNWQSAKFPTCSKPGHHACLGGFISDGNIPFRTPIS